MKRLALVLIACACALAAPIFARAQVTCPATLAVSQTASAPSPDWAVSNSGYPVAVAGVTIFDGPPAEQASLVPDNDQTAGDSTIQTWRLPSSTRGYWLQCNYANTTAQISQRLPAGVTRCDVTYDRNMHFGGGGGAVVKSVICK